MAMNVNGPPASKSTDEPAGGDITSWVEVREMEPLLRNQHAFAQSGAGSRGTGYYVKKWTSIVGSVLFLLLVGVGTFVVAWNRPTTASQPDVDGVKKAGGAAPAADPRTTHIIVPESDPADAAATPASMTSTGVAATSPVSITATALPGPAQMPAISVRTVALPPTVLAAQPPATASYKSAKPTLIPWEVQKSHPTYVPSRIPTFSFEWVDGGLAYGALQADGYHPEAMEGWHPDVRSKRRAQSGKAEQKKEAPESEPSLIQGYQDDDAAAPE